MVSANKADMVASLKPKNEWDICAGQIILEEAGGFLMNIRNMSVPIYNQKKTFTSWNLNLHKKY